MPTSATLCRFDSRDIVCSNLDLATSLKLKRNIPLKIDDTYLDLFSLFSPLSCSEFLFGGNYPWTINAYVFGISQ